MTNDIIYDDFTGFTFNGRHSSEFNILVTSDGSRFNRNLLPPSHDNIIDTPNRDGSYFGNSKFESQQFPVNFAYDNVSEENIREMRRWLSEKKECELIFDETPYKVYRAKVTSTPQLNYVCFDNDEGKRVYKGEGNIVFICYYPFAKTPADKKWKNQWTNSKYKNTEQWLESSGIISNDNHYNMTTDNYTTINLYNGGDLDTPFKLYFNPSRDSTNKKILLELYDIDDTSNIPIEGYSMLLDLSKLPHSEEGLYCLDTSLHIIRKDAELFSYAMTGGDYFKIPKGKYKLKATGFGDTATFRDLGFDEIEYGYIYY